MTHEQAINYLTSSGMTPEQVMEIVEALAEPYKKYCDRDICARNEYSGIGCEDCEVNKPCGETITSGYAQEIRIAEPCADCVSRLAVLDCFTATKLKKFDFILYAREEIKKLPSVTPTQKMGRWIATEDGFECSECGCISRSRANFCQYCGAKMEVDE